MKKLIAAAMLLQLVGCATFKPLPVIHSDVAFQQKADDMYKIASQCWNQSTGLVTFGTAVTRSGDDRQVVIEARYVSAGEESGMHQNRQEPFIKLIIQPAATGSTVTIFQKTLPHIGQAEHVYAAKKWAKGVYTC